MELPILFYYNDKQYIKTKFIIKQKKDELVLEFGNPPFLSDNLTSFHELEFFESNYLWILLKGRCNRYFSFEDESSFAAFSLLLQKKFELCLIQSANNNKFLLKKKHHNSSSVVSLNSAKRSLIFNRDPIKKRFKQNREFLFDEFLPKEMIFYEAIKIRKDNLNDAYDKERKCFLKDVMFSKLVFNNEAIGKLFFIKFMDDFENELNDYKNVKKQWELITEEQWLNNSLLRRYVEKLESYIEQTDFNLASIKKILFNVMVTYCVFYYFIEFNPVVFRFACLFLKTYVNGFISDESILDFEGNKRKPEEMEAIIFWSLQKFDQQYLSETSFSYKLIGIDVIYEFITKQFYKYFPQIESFFKNNPLITNFKFFTRPISNLFTEGRSFKESQKLILLFTYSSEPLYTFIGFIMSIISQFNLFDLSTMCEDFIGEYLCSTINNIDFNLLFYNIDNFLLYVKEGIQ